MTEKEKTHDFFLEIDNECVFFILNFTFLNKGSENVNPFWTWIARLLHILDMDRQNVTCL